MEGSIQTCAIECGAKCCSLPKIVMLTSDEAHKLKSMGRGAALTKNTNGQWVMLFTKGACVFLAKDRTCSIYEERPVSCRAFPHKPVSYCLLWPKSN